MQCVQPLANWLNNLMVNEYVYTVWLPSPRGWVPISTLGWVLQLTVQLSLCCQTTSLYLNWKEKNNMKVKIKKQSCNARLCTIKGMQQWSDISKTALLYYWKKCFNYVSNMQTFYTHHLKYLYLTELFISSNLCNRN